jgi:lipopolysaccharide transport system ATP-binding protein
VKDRMDEIIAFSELGEFIDEPVRTYSSGMYMRLAFAVATHVDPDILIVDEILAVGDEHFSRKSRAKMNEFKRRGKTIVLVTHDLGTLETWCDSAAWIDAGRIRELGAPPDVIRHYRRALALAEASGTPMVAPALDPRGGALPDLEAGNVAAQGVQLTSLRLLDPQGREVEELDTESGMELVLAYAAQEAVEQATFGVCIRHTDGTRLYQTTTVTDGVAMPQPLPRQGELRLSIERLGLVAGRYELEVFVETRAGGPARAHLTGAFGVRSAVLDEGLVRPFHRWTVSGGPSEAAQSPSRHVGT